MSFNYLILSLSSAEQGPSGFRDSTGRTVLGKGGGGGGDDGGAAQREKERQDRIASGTLAVNQLFGVGDDATAQSNLTSRNALYDSTREDTRAYYAKQLEEDRADAERQLKFAKARMGTTGSSQANDIDTEYQKALDRGLLTVANNADSAATQFKNNDETARLNLITKIVNGIDQGSAVQNAMNTMQTNAAQAKEAYQSERMANVFSDLLSAYNLNQYNQGTQAGKTQYGNNTGNYFSNNTGTSGTVTKS